MIIGTAGHIDHGKTTLIEALTGMKTDRLKEEKRRGITIELGFAHLDLPKERVGIVDVPGHERFVKHMVAGIAAVDLVLFVVAADEGMMPQSHEHLMILDDLGIDRGIFVLTKADQADEELMAIVREDVQRAKAGTHLEKAPILAVDSLSGRGIKALRETIVQSLVKTRKSQGPFRLHIDRAFTLKGLGWIVTGTALSGAVEIDDSLLLYPLKKPVRVRSIEVHGEQVDRATGGHRVALSLVGEGTKFLERGQLLSSLTTLETTMAVDCAVSLHRELDFSLASGDSVRVSVGTREVMARLFLYGKEGLVPGEEGFAQLRFEEPQVFFPSEVLILRRVSPVTTMGRGQVLLSTAKKKKRYDREHLAHLEQLTAGDASTVVSGALATLEPIADPEVLIAPTALDRSVVIATFDQLLGQGAIVERGGLYFRKESEAVFFRALKEAMDRQLKKNPFAPGILPLSLYTAGGFSWPRRFFYDLVDRLVQRGDWMRLKTVVAPVGYVPAWTPSHRQEMTKLIHYYREAGSNPQSVNGLVETLGLSEKKDALLAYLVETRALVSIDDTHYLDPEVYEEMKKNLKALLADRGEVDLKAAKALWQTSRKMTITLLEHFDQQGVTTREGDKRIAHKGV